MGDYKFNFTKEDLDYEYQVVRTMFHKSQDCLEEPFYWQLFFLGDLVEELIEEIEQAIDGEPEEFEDEFEDECDWAYF